ncbi:MAG: hypothetical protein OXU26_12685 [Acidobacteriota bacterium]|nr:hypothetical protein [Acidobacteriota bacterium]MDE2964763.1 hypothetical protein [Acidobacteriota bacterium]
MIISPELIAIGILGVSLVSLGWKVTGDLRQEIHHVRQDVGNVRQDVADVRQDVAGLRERMARLEGLFEGFTKRELAEQQK